MSTNIWTAKCHYDSPKNFGKNSNGILRKEVIQPQVPLRLPCYDFTPVADRTVVKGFKLCLKV